MPNTHGGDSHDSHGSKDKSQHGSGGKEKESHGAKEAKGVIGKLIESALAPLERFLPKKNLNVLLSVLNPWLDESAETVAEKARKYTEQYPWLQNKIVGSAIGAFAAQIEEAAEKYDEPTKVFFKKASDWFETFATALQNASPKHEVHTDSKVTGLAKEAFVPVRVARMKEEQERLAKASHAESPAVRLKIIEDAKTLAESEELMLRGIKKPDEPSVPFGEQIREVVENIDQGLHGTFAPVNHRLSQTLDSLTAGNEERRQALEQKPQNQSRTLSGAKRLSRFFFGFPR